MSFPGNRTQQNPEPGSSGLTAESSPQPGCVLPRCSALFPFPDYGASGELTNRVCENVVNTGSAPHPTPERPLALYLKEQKGNMGAPGLARSPLPSHPGNPESFPCVYGWGFLGVCLPQASPG